MNMYKDYFDLDIMPFNTTPDAAFFFASEQHKEALARLKYAIEERKGFVLITGEIGAGKTTVCHTLLSQLDNHVKTALITNTRLTSKELLKSICTEFEIECKHSTRLEMLNKLNDFLIEQLCQDNNAVIIIDEAQNLSSKLLEEVRLISNLETDKEKLVQIILMGQPELSEKLELPELKQLKQRIVTRYHIYPMNPEECVKYVQHRLYIAGLNHERIFTPAALQEVIKFSGGIPRLINIICDQALLQAFSMGAHKIDNVLINEVIKEYIPPKKLPAAFHITGNVPDELQNEGPKMIGEEAFLPKKKKFLSKLFSFRNKQPRNADNNFEENLDDLGIMIEFDGVDISKMKSIEKRIKPYLIGKPKGDKIVVREEYFDKFRHELKKIGIYIEMPE
ncbi:MAG: AAA family ATPase [bacterium]|nr:AAA family ATPase [bacterium]